MIGQTLIPVSVDNELTFSNFIVGENGAVIQQLESLVALISRNDREADKHAEIDADQKTDQRTDQDADLLPRLVYLWAESGAGKTHLVHGLCEQARSVGAECQFLSLSEANIANCLKEHDFAARLVCVDNLQVICGDRELEIAFLSFYERLRASGGFLVVAARKPPNESGFVLADLVSRLNAGGIWRVTPMTDSDKRTALQRRAEVRGFAFNSPVIDFVMSHFARDTVSLFALLDQLDRASLAHHRKITVPFVKEVIGA